MLSDEEREAIIELKHYCNLTQYWKNVEYTKPEFDDYVKTILDLIEKQSKEIEHQKEKRENQKQELAILNAKQIEFNKLKNTVNSYKGQFKRQQKEIEELKETLKCTQNSWYEDTKVIEKQSKEIEELKADKYGLEEEVQIQAKQLIEIDGNYISKEESEQRERKAYIKGTNDADELCNKKWKNKIKAKIEEVHYKMIAHQDVREAVKLALQSLLEKE